MIIDDLFPAVALGDDGVIEYLRTHPEFVHVRNPKANPESKQWNEVTLLHTAAKFGHLGIVKGLVELGAEVYSNPTCTYPPVIVAAWEDHQHVVDYFLKEIPHLAEGTCGLGVTCNLAGREGWSDIVRRHIEFDPLAVHQRGWIGDTPLHWPSHNGFDDIVRMLLEAGGDPNAHVLHWVGGTPLHWAAERHPSIIRILVAAGADVNARVQRADSNHLGATPLIWCAKQRDDAGDAAEALLELGADPNLTDAAGNTAEHYARRDNRRRVLATLQSKTTI